MGEAIDVKHIFNVFLLKFKKHVLCFKMLFVLFKCRVLLLLKQNVQIYKYDAFLMSKDSISWTE